MKNKTHEIHNIQLIKRRGQSFKLSNNGELQTASLYKLRYISVSDCQVVYSKTACSVYIRHNFWNDKCIQHIRNRKERDSLFIQVRIYIIQDLQFEIELVVKVKGASCMYCMPHFMSERVCCDEVVIQLHQSRRICDTKRKGEIYEEPHGFVLLLCVRVI